MKRTIPLWITAIGGFVLIASYFIPATQSWGEVAAIWFDILAAIAFVLGGGNLLKVQLKKISDRSRGWGYAVVTLAAFLVTFVVGLAKFGTPPAPDQQFYGETFAPLPLDAFPESQVASVEGELPNEEGSEDMELPPSLRLQTFERDGQIGFRGWMQGNQQGDLLALDNTLRWQCTVERLAQAARPPEPLRGKVAYYAFPSVLSFRGAMSAEYRDNLNALSDDARWRTAVESLFQRSNRTTRVNVGALPPSVDPANFPPAIQYDAAQQALVASGPVSVAQREQIARQFPISHPLDADERAELLRELESRGGSLTPAQRMAFDRNMEGLWSVEQFRLAVSEAGKGQASDKTACELLEEQLAGVDDIQALTPAGEDVSLNEAQSALLADFANDETMSANTLIEQLQASGPLTGGQEEAVRTFVAQTPTIGERNRKLWESLLREGPLTREQQAFLLEPYQTEVNWHQQAGRLFAAAHIPKYEWSGEYNSGGSAFWWIYQYLLKPLTATMFALLAFYVASAAFRAFRAKNVEAILLLGTAFIILLGQTFAGVLLTSWIPPDSAFSGFRVDSLTFYIMRIFNTAGNRAIMIGIALGIVSTSLKILLGVDRSWLGSSDD